MEDIDLLKKRILTQSDYEIVQNNNNINLYDNVILYSIGNGKFRIVDFNVINAYPIIYDKHTDNSTVEDISVIVCPLSLRATVLKGKFKINSYIDTLLILEDNKNNILPINMKKKIDENYNIYINKRFDVKIMKLKNAIMYSSDATFIIPLKKYKNIIDHDYYENYYDINNNIIETKYHPKTLCYLIYYNFDDVKRTGIILGKDINKNAVSGYNLDKSGITEYLNKRHNKIIEKNIYIMPILLYIALKEYEDLYILSVNK